MESFCHEISIIDRCVSHDSLGGLLMIQGAFEMNLTIVELTMIIGGFNVMTDRILCISIIYEKF